MSFGLLAWLLLSSHVSSPTPPPAKVARIVSLAPTLSEIVCALDACGRLVGVTRFDDYPERLRQVPKVGGYVDPSLEAIVKLAPDLVVLTKNGANQAFVRALDKQKIAWIAFSDQTLEDFASITAKLAEVLDRRAQAAALIQGFDRELTALARLPKLGRSALVVYGHAPLVIAGPGSFASEMLSRCGLENAYAGGQRYPTVDFETVVRMMPAIVVDVDMDGAGRSSPQYWAPVRSALSATFVFAPDPALMRLGPRLPSAMLALRKKIDTALVKQ
jgi:iron complex transport system substrate-binding protein